MGIGFTENGSEAVLPPQNVVQVSAEYGLSMGQMRVLGISNESFSKLPEVEPVGLHNAPLFEAYSSIALFQLRVCFPLVLAVNHNGQGALRGGSSGRNQAPSGADGC